MENSNLNKAIVIVLIIIFSLTIIYIQTLSVLYLVGIFSCSLKTLLILQAVSFVTVYCSATYIIKFLLDR